MELLTIGPAHTLVAATVYALPARRTICRVQQAGGTIQVSNDNGTFAAVTLDANSQFEPGGLFIKAVTTDAIVRFAVA